MNKGILNILLSGICFLIVNFFENFGFGKQFVGLSISTKIISSMTNWYLNLSFQYYS
jgi:hypothetical protein